MPDGPYQCSNHGSFEMPSESSLQEETCPVADQLLGEMYRASADGLARLVETVSPAARTMLAVYCYRRAHLSSIGLTIAATCEKDDLAFAGGNAGAVLYDRARESPLSSFPDARPHERRKITLSSGPLCQPNTIPDDEEEAVA
jgi:hypothetical protein